MNTFINTFDKITNENPVAGAVIYHKGKIIVIGSISEAIEQARQLEGTAIVVGQCIEAISQAAGAAIGALTILEYNDGIFIGTTAFNSISHLNEVRKVSCDHCDAADEDTIENLSRAGWSVQKRNQICPEHNTEDFLSNLV